MSSSRFHTSSKVGANALMQLPELLGRREASFYV